MNKRTLAFIAAFSAGLGISVVTAQPIPVGGGSSAVLSPLSIGVIDAGTVWAHQYLTLGDTSNSFSIGGFSSGGVNGEICTVGGASTFVGSVQIKGIASTGGAEAAVIVGNKNALNAGQSLLQLRNGPLFSSTKVVDMLADGSATFAAGLTLTTGNATVSSGNISASGTVTSTGSYASFRGYKYNSQTFMEFINPTVGSGFGTSPSITASAAGTMGFRVNIGSGGTANSGVINFSTSAQTGWKCTCDDITTPATNRTVQSAFTTTSCTMNNYNTTTGAAAAWTASDVLLCDAHGF